MQTIEPLLMHRNSYTEIGRINILCCKLQLATKKVYAEQFFDQSCKHETPCLIIILTKLLSKFGEIGAINCGHRCFWSLYLLLVSLFIYGVHFYSIENLQR